MQIPVLVEVRTTLCVCNRCSLIMSRFPANHLAGLISMQDLVPMQPTLVSPNHCGTTAGAFATTPPTPAASPRCKVVVSYHFGKLFVGSR